MDTLFSPPLLLPLIFPAIFNLSIVFFVFCFVLISNSDLLEFSEAGSVAVWQRDGRDLKLPPTKAVSFFHFFLKQVPHFFGVSVKGRGARAQHLSPFLQPGQRRSVPGLEEGTGCISTDF